MKISHYEQQGTIVVALQGNLVLDKVGEVRQYLKPHLAGADMQALLFNFEGVNFIDSSGIGFVVSVFRTLQQQQKQFGLVSLSSKISDIFSITRLDKVFRIYPTENQGLEEMVQWCRTGKLSDSVNSTPDSSAAD